MGGAAMSAGEKATAVKEYGLLNHSMCLWTEVCKVERLLRYYSNRIEGKKHQLQGLQTMFRTFATQLETGLRDGTPRDAASIKNGSKRMNKTEGAVSLPNIHKQSPADKISNCSSRTKARRPAFLGCPAVIQHFLFSDIL